MLVAADKYVKDFSSGVALLKWYTVETNRTISICYYRLLSVQLLMVSVGKAVKFVIDQCPVLITEDKCYICVRVKDFPIFLVWDFYFESLPSPCKQNEGGNNAPSS